MGVAAEGVAVLPVDRLGHTVPGLRLSKRNHVECAQPNHEIQTADSGANSLNHFSQEPSAILESSSIGSRAVHGTQELVPQVPVAMLDIYETITALRGQARRRDEIADEIAHLVVVQDRVFGRNAELAVQNRMVVENLRLHAVLPVRPAETAGMRQLQADQ
jgi:hypothetical protein